MTFDPNDPRLHDGSRAAKRPAHLPPPAQSVIHQAHAAADRRRQELCDMYVLAGTPLSAMAPDELARRVQSMAGASLTIQSTSDTLVWSSLLAMCLEGWRAAATAEEMDVSSGDAA